MKKKLLYFFFIICFLITNSQKTYADLLKPNIKYKPRDVIKIQLSALKNNNIPYINAGIEQTWEFAHPSNKSSTGPLSKFVLLLSGKEYNILLNHIEHRIAEVFKSEDKFIYEVTILDREKNFFKYQWQIEKFVSDGPLKNCWMTTSVSLPLSLGSSI